MNSNRTPEKASAFCAALAETCNIGKACAAVGMGRRTAYDWRAADASFAAAWDAALKIGITALEDEAHRRAFEGTDKPIVHLGKVTGHMTYSYRMHLRTKTILSDHWLKPCLMRG